MIDDAGYSIKTTMYTGEKQKQVNGIWESFNITLLEDSSLKLQTDQEQDNYSINNTRKTCNSDVENGVTNIKIHGGT